MGRPAAVAHMTYTEYLAAEDKSEVRHEYLNGEVWEMTGGTPDHGALAIAVGGELRAALRGKRCRIYSSDVRVRVPETGLSTYPDLSVVCERLETAPDDENGVVNPVLLVEVVSDSTEAYDRGVKAAHYRRIPSLREYVFVSQREPHIEVHRRAASGRWELLEAGRGESIELESLGVRLAVDAVYANPLEAADRGPAA